MDVFAKCPACNKEDTFGWYVIERDCDLPSADEIIDCPCGYTLKVKSVDITVKIELEKYKSAEEVEKESRDDWAKYQEDQKQKIVELRAKFLANKDNSSFVCKLFGHKWLRCATTKSNQVFLNNDLADSLSICKRCLKFLDLTTSNKIVWADSLKQVEDRLERGF